MPDKHYLAWQSFEREGKGRNAQKRAPRVSLAPKNPFPKTPFLFPFKRLPPRLDKHQPGDQTSQLGKSEKRGETAKKNSLPRLSPARFARQFFPHSSRRQALGFNREKRTRHANDHARALVSRVQRLRRSLLARVHSAHQSSTPVASLAYGSHSSGLYWGET